MLISNINEHFYLPSIDHEFFFQSDILSITFDYEALFLLFY